MTAEVTPFARKRELLLAAEDQLRLVCSDTSIVQVLQNWLNATLSKFDHHYNKCEEQLREIQRGVREESSYWCAKTVIQQGKLHLTERRLLHKNSPTTSCTSCSNNATVMGGSNNPSRGGSDTNGSSGLADGEPSLPALPDLVELLSCFHRIQAQPTTTPAQRRFLEQSESELRRTVLEPRDIGFLTAALQTKLCQDDVRRQTHSHLLACERVLDDLLPDVQQCEQLLESSIQNGEMAIAESISVRQLEVYEHMLRTVQNAYPVLTTHYRDTQDFDRRRRWAIFRLAPRDLSVVMEHAERQSEACVEDVNKVRLLSDRYAAEDVAQRRRYDADCQASDRVLREHKERQQAVWNRVQALGQELRSSLHELHTLAQSRQGELTRRMEAEAQEAARRGSYAGYCRAAAQHQAGLRATQENAHAVRQWTSALHRFVLDGCDGAAARWDAHQMALALALRTLQQRHHRLATDYLIAAHRLCYHKERKLAQLRTTQRGCAMRQALCEESALDAGVHAKGFALGGRAVESSCRELELEVHALRQRMANAEAAVAPAMASLARAGLAVVHPGVLAAEMNRQRWSSVLDWREEVDPDRAPQRDVEEQEREKKAIQRDREAAEGCREERHRDDTADGAYSYRAGDKNMRLLCCQQGHQASRLLPWEQRVPALLQKRLPLMPENIPACDSNASERKDSPASDMTVTAQAMLSHATTVSTRPVSLPPLPLHGRCATASTLSTTASTKIAPAATTTTTTTQAASDSSSSSSSAAATGLMQAAALTSSSCSSCAEPCEKDLTRRNVSGWSSDYLDSCAASSGAVTGVLRTLEGAVMRARYAYKARAPDELSFDEGEHIVCVSRTEEEGWFKGVCNQRTGLFPINYVERLNNLS